MQTKWSQCLYGPWLCALASCCLLYMHSKNMQHAEALLSCKQPLGGCGSVGDLLLLTRAD